MKNALCKISRAGIWGKMGVWMFLFLGVLLFSSLAGAQQPTATIKTLNGIVSVSGQTAREGMVLRAGDTIQTQSGASAVLELSDGSTLELDENTSLDMAILTRQTDGARVSRLKLLWGRVRAVLSPDHQTEGSTFNVETPNALVGVRFSQPIVEVLYDPEKQETIGIAHSVELFVTNLLTSETALVPVGSSIIITPTSMEILAGAATGIEIFGGGSGTMTVIGVSAAAAGGVVAVVVQNNKGNDPETADSTGDLSGTWNLQAQGVSQGCTVNTPCMPDPPYLCGIDICGSFGMGDSDIQIAQNNKSFSMSGTDGNGNPYTLSGSIAGTSVTFTIQGTGITPGIGPATTTYTGTIQGNTVQGDFTGSASWQTPAGATETATWSGTFSMDIQR